eukprot:g625.t1
MGTYPNVVGILQESIQTSFDDGWDVFPDGRKKYIHSVGAVCKFSIDISDQSPYTGLLQKSTSFHGLFRMGPAKPLTSDGVVPGIGWKILRDKVRSANFVTLYTLTGQKGFNFFLKNQSNHIPSPTEGVLKFLAKKFNQASSCAEMVGLSDITMYGQDGKAAPNGIPVFPFRLDFVPTGEYITNNSQVNLSELLDGLMKIPIGTKLYSLHAYASPDDYIAGKGLHLGDVSTASECTTSAFGDAKLFFRHQRIEEDFLLKPSWRAHPQVTKMCGQKVAVNAPKRCGDYTQDIEVEMR